MPIHTIVKPKKASDFRPVNMLSIFGKVLELLVRDQLEKFLEINDIIKSDYLERVIRAKR